MTLPGLALAEMTDDLSVLQSPVCARSVPRFPLGWRVHMEVEHTEAELKRGVSSRACLNTNRHVTVIAANCRDVRLVRASAGSSHPKHQLATAQLSGTMATQARLPCVSLWQDHTSGEEVSRVTASSTDYRSLSSRVL